MKMSKDQVEQAALRVAKGWRIDNAIRDVIDRTEWHRAAEEAARRTALETACQELGIDPDAMVPGYAARWVAEHHPEYSRRVPNPGEDPTTIVWVVDEARIDEIPWPWSGIASLPRPASELPEGWTADGIGEVPGAEGGASPVRVLDLVHPADMSRDAWMKLHEAAQHDYLYWRAKSPAVAAQVLDRVAELARRDTIVSWDPEDEAAVRARAEELRTIHEEAKSRTSYLRKWCVTEADSFRETVNSRLPRELSIGIRCMTTVLNGTAIDIQLWFSDGSSMDRPIGLMNICREIPTVDEIVSWARRVAKADPRARRVVEGKEA